MNFAKSIDPEDDDDMKIMTVKNEYVQKSEWIHVCRRTTYFWTTQSYLPAGKSLGASLKLLLRPLVLRLPELFVLNMA